MYFIEILIESMFELFEGVACAIFSCGVSGINVYMMYLSSACMYLWLYDLGVIVGCVSYSVCASIDVLVSVKSFLSQARMRSHLLEDGCETPLVQQCR